MFSEQPAPQVALPCPVCGDDKCMAGHSILLTGDFMPVKTAALLGYNEDDLKQDIERINAEIFAQINGLPHTETTETGTVELFLLRGEVARLRRERDCILAVLNDGALADETVNKVVLDICDRSGLQNEREEIDDEVKEEIKTIWAKIIQDAYRARVLAEVEKKRVA
ncbi:MAG: hypothetical protein WC497_05525 [Patescibacteria group bacterium]